MNVTDELSLGRKAYEARAWGSAAEALAAADALTPLDADDLERFATALFMLGREEEHYAAFERAHQRHLESGSTARAARCAFWIGMKLLMGGAAGRGGGWLARATRLLEGEDDCVERGYLLLPDAYRKQAEGDCEGAIATAGKAMDIARRFGDADLFALAANTQGDFMIALGQVPEALGVLDEAMIAVIAGEVSPLPTGIVYCSAISSCRSAFDPRRAEEWTTALDAWCQLQPDMLAFTGDCHVHRAEIMQLRGAWSDAVEELDRAAQRATLAGNTRVAAHAAYCRGEILRLRGELADAEQAFREAARDGCEPQPGLSLLRLALGDDDSAVASIRRVLDEAETPVARATLLPAFIEIMLAVGDLGSAQEACDQLEAIAAERPSVLLAATLDHMRGAVELARGDASAALRALRRALAGWQDLHAPYEAARVRVLVAEACRELGDADSASLDLEAARESFSLLGAVEAGDGGREMHGLTARELEVLRLVAGGATNKQIASELILSDRTIDRHVSNIFAKLGVSSRAAATAYAYRHRLL
jgi:DNA-binding NarL/FixJ family response regulator